MMKKGILLLAVSALFLALSTTSLMAEGNDSPGGKGKGKQSSPFLITSKLPHLTKILIQQWENPRLDLSEEQKAKLLVVRKETIGAVQQLEQKVSALEQRVAEGIFAGKTPEELQPLVQKIARLKAEATMVQLRCIYDTSTILDQQQMDMLRTF